MTKGAYTPLFDVGSVPNWTGVEREAVTVMSDTGVSFLPCLDHCRTVRTLLEPDPAADPLVQEYKNKIRALLDVNPEDKATMQDYKVRLKDALSGLMLEVPLSVWTLVQFAVSVAVNPKFGVLTRPALDVQLSVFSRTNRFPMVWVVLDVDGLKQMNDKCGKAQADKVIQRILDEVRWEFSEPNESGVVGSPIIYQVHSGDEFTFPLPVKGDVSKFLRRVRRKVAKLKDRLRSIELTLPLLSCISPKIRPKLRKEEALIGQMHVHPSATFSVVVQYSGEREAVERLFDSADKSITAKKFRKAHLHGDRRLRMDADEEVPQVPSIAAA